MSYIAPLSLSDCIGDLRDGKKTVEELISEICDRVDSVEPVIHALIPEEARRERLLNEAKLLEQKFPNQKKRPLLYGIPVGVKDLFRVDGFYTKAGSQLPESLFEGRESAVVTKLKAAGALILGKTVTTEFAYFQPGPTCNPHKITHTPGGSSSGSAAAVACGFTPLSLGTQTIGSVSRPASFCGVFGFKPSFNRITTKGVIPFSPSADHVGFFTQDLLGVGITASILCDEWDSGVEVPAGLPVIGVAAGSYLAQADVEVLRFFEERVSQLEKIGCKILRTDPFGDIEPINITHRNMIASEFASAHETWFNSRGELYRKHSRELVESGRLVSSELLKDARHGRKILRDRIDRISKQHGIDLWLSPSSCTPAPEGLGSTGSPLMNLPWTYMGLPTLSVPSGFTASGLPLGLQFAGSLMQDELLLAWMKQVAI